MCFNWKEHACRARQKRKKNQMKRLGVKFTSCFVYLFRCLVDLSKITFITLTYERRNTNFFQEQKERNRERETWWESMLGSGVRNVQHHQSMFTRPYYTRQTHEWKEKKISLPIFSSSQRFKYLVSTHTQGEKYRSQQQRDTQFNDKNTAGKMIGGGIDTSKLQRLKTSFWSF